MMSLFDDEQIMKTYWKDIEKESARKKAKLMLKDRKITQNEIPIYFPELSSEDIEEVVDEIMQLV